MEAILHLRFPYEEPDPQVRFNAIHIIVLTCSLTLTITFIHLTAITAWTPWSVTTITSSQLLFVPPIQSQSVTVHNIHVFINRNMNVCIRSCLVAWWYIYDTCEVIHVKCTHSLMRFRNMNVCIRSNFLIKFDHLMMMCMEMKRHKDCGVCLTLLTVATALELSLNEAELTPTINTSIHHRTCDTLFYRWMSSFDPCLHM